VNWASRPRNPGRAPVIARVISMIRPSVVSSETGAAVRIHRRHWSNTNRSASPA
jgi:hypothetical protein